MLRMGSLSSTVLSVGPFGFEVETDCAGVCRSIDCHYSNQIITDPGFDVDFHIAILRKGPDELCIAIDHAPYFQCIPLAHSPLSLEWAINYAVYQWMHRYLIFHSAALKCDQTLVLFPADSGSGKSTLSASLMLSGWQLFSDELAIIEGVDAPSVHCFAKPVNLKNGSVNIIADKYPQAIFGDPIPATDKGDVRLLKHKYIAENPPAPVGGVVFVQWCSGAAASLVEVSPKKAFEQLLENAVNYTLRREDGFKQVCQIIGTSKLFQLTYSDLDEGIALLNAEFKR